MSAYNFAAPPPAVRVTAMKPASTMRKPASDSHRAMRATRSLPRSARSANGSAAASITPGTNAHHMPMSVATV